MYLLAGYQEETFVGDKNKLAKLSGAFSYIVGVATIIFPHSEREKKRYLAFGNKNLMLLK